MADLNDDKGFFGKLFSPGNIPKLAGGALGIGSLLGSLFSNDPKFQSDPQIGKLIEALKLRSEQGLSPEAQASFLQTGRQGIGNQTTAARHEANKHLSRIGAGSGSLASSIQGNLSNDANSKELSLNRGLTQLNEQTKSDSFSQLLSALGLKTQADLGQFNSELATTPDFGGGLGNAILSLLIK